jgi:type IV conjugative transfer system coupling protein TraD
MSTFSGSFTQGGQTQLHKLRMIKQVMGATLKVCLGLAVLSFLGLLYKDHVWQEFWYLLCYGKATLRTSIAVLPSGLFDSCWIVFADGQTLEISDYFMVHDQASIRSAHLILSSVLNKFLQSIIIAGAGGIIVSWFWVKMGRKRQEKKILSGFTLVEPTVLKKLVKKSGASPYILEGVPLPKDAEFQHMMVTGTTGSGKSNMIHHLLKQIRTQGDEAVIIDTTGGIFSRFYNAQTDVLLNPLDARSKHWNLWEELAQDSLLEEIAESMIPDNHRSSDLFWTQSARQLFCETVRYLGKYNQKSYQELTHMALKLPLKDLHQLLEGTAASALLDPAIDKTALSIRASLATYLRAFDALNDTQEGFSFLKFVEQTKNKWLFLSCQPDQRELLKPLFSAWLSIVIKGLMRRPEGYERRMWIIIDELASLNRLPFLLTGLAEVRKYGGCFVLGFQDLSQLDDIYGFSATKNLSNLTGTKVLFRCVDGEIAARFSRYLGEQEKQEASESISFGAHQMRDGVSLSSQKQTKAVVSASDIMMLPDLEAFVKFPSDFPISKVVFKYLDLVRKEPTFIPNNSSLIRKEAS